MTEKSKSSDAGVAILGGVGCVLLGAASLFWVGCGLGGIHITYGAGWSLFASFLVFGLHFTLPLVWGAYLFARTVWDWPVVGAVLFAAPGLLLLIPVVVASLVDALRGSLRSGR